MEIGVGLDSRLGLSTAQLLDLATPARELGYSSVWTNAGIEYDPIGLCIGWTERSGLPSGVSVVPLARNPAPVLALASRTAFELTGGRFTLGVGSGGVLDRPIRAVRDYVAEVRKIAPNVPIAIGALGPQMLRLASQVAQAAALNWCTPAQIKWSREIVGSKTRLVMYIRVSVDDDVAAARLALAKQILAYAVVVRPTGARGYRAHFERMGFGAEIAELEARKAKGASDDELARVMPERLVSSFGCYGDGRGAREKFLAMSQGLDVAIVRVLAARPGDVDAVRATMRAMIA